MRVGYADPPYPGRSARLYADHPDYAGEVDSVALVADLVADYDAFALHTSSPALCEILPGCPEGARVLAWCKGWASWKPGVSPAFAWEPIIIAGHRRRSDATKVRDFLLCNATTQLGFPGAKPTAVALWVFDALGLEPEDELVDLYPGTGAIGHAWEIHKRRIRIPFDSGEQLEIGPGR